MRTAVGWGRLAAVAGVGAAAFVVAGLGSEAASSAAVGTCVDGAKQPADCADPAAVYQVLATAKTRSGCPTGDYFFHEPRTGTAEGLCLGYNVRDGDCVQDDPEHPRRVPCATEVTTPTFRVLHIVEGRATVAACRDGESGTAGALTYAVPKRTLCLEHLPLVTR